MINKFFKKLFLSTKTLTPKQHLIYTQPLDPSQILLVNPRRFIPSHLAKPPHADKVDYKGNSNYSIVTDENDIKKLRKACSIAAEAVRRAVEGVEKGECKTTEDIDVLTHDYIISQNGYPSGVGFNGFPKSVCTSVNEGKISINIILVVCHGIPNRRPLQKGDSLNIDVTAYYEGFHGDTSSMACIGDVHPDIKKLVTRYIISIIITRSELHGNAY
jgi:methionyl aminopeptidase